MSKPNLKPTSNPTLQNPNPNPSSSSSSIVPPRRDQPHVSRAPDLAVPLLPLLSLARPPPTFPSSPPSSTNLLHFPIAAPPPPPAHAHVLALGFAPSVVVSGALLTAYAKCRLLGHARKVFDEMPVRDVLAWTALVHGYSTSGDLVSACKLFDQMPSRNTISWTALIGGLNRNGEPYEALDMFRKMMYQCVRPDQFTFSSTLCACAATASLTQGKQIHGYVLRSKFNPNSIVLSSLVDMYSKCGDLLRARWVFELTHYSKRDTVLWNTIISALGHHGHGKEAIKLFDEMVKCGRKPDANTFVVLLTSCSHSGLVEEGVRFFESMAKIHGVVRQEDHYVCLVDLLGRNGRFKEAMEWLAKEPCRSSARARNALLGACRVHGNVELGKQVAEQLIELEPNSSAKYVLLSNMYAEDGNWEHVEKLRGLMEESQVRKERASSWI
ncbi:pentatricopeptide repeat-containing protein At2g21090-like [Ananas comosus]|uniref:Pentatricopeptide repeat-containing protein At2g21090-like n=1 Tax=Ananas comosus TaxID=4615 RepID=A0A6P5FHL7_ANACO|nr:pentatricopeptide repeat-containing protein At2g21090-like [Ananas comosus]